MEELKKVIVEYDYLINISTIFLVFAIGSLFLFLKTKKKEDLIVFQVFSIIILVVINFIIKPIFVKTYPIYEKGDCFLYKKVINPKPTEDWHKDYLERKLEFLVLRVGKENYYVSSSAPNLGDFPIKLDGKSVKSDCSIIYKK